MFHDLGGQSARSPSILLGIPLFAGFRLLLKRLFRVRFDEGWRGRFLLFQLVDPSKGDTQQVLRLFQRFTQVLVFLLQLEDLFFCHTLSVSERSSLNSFKELDTVPITRSYHY